MKCPQCGHLATDTDKVCFSCKKYIGNTRATEKIGGETNYMRLFPLLFAVVGVPMFLAVYTKYIPGAARVPTYDPERLMLAATVGAGLAAIGWVIGRLLGDGTTVRI